MLTKEELRVIFDQVLKDEFPSLLKRRVNLIFHNKIVAFCYFHELKPPYFDPVVFVNSARMPDHKKICQKIFRHELLHIESGLRDNNQRFYCLAKKINAI